MRKTVVIADDEPITRMDISEILTLAGYNVVGLASDGLDAINLCREYKPDIVLMDIKMPVLDGLKSSEIILTEKIVDCVILLTAYSTMEFIEMAKSIGISGYVMKPVDEKNLVPAIEIGLSRAQEVKAMEEQVQAAKDKLEARKLIEKAKGILIEKEKLTEEEAYKKIRRLSMDKRISMADIAQIVILNYRGD